MNFLNYYLCKHFRRVALSSLNVVSLSVSVLGNLQVDSANKRGSLLDVVQALNDLNLIIRRAYISSDGEWFMDGKLFGSNFCNLAFNFVVVVVFL